jgi:hypothetical protein
LACAGVAAVSGVADSIHHHTATAIAVRADPAISKRGDNFDIFIFPANALDCYIEQ